MKDHDGNELELGDWVRLRADKERNHVQIVKFIYGQMVVTSHRRNALHTVGNEMPRNSRVFIKLEPEDLI